MALSVAAARLVVVAAVADAVDVVVAAQVPMIQRNAGLFSRARQLVSAIVTVRPLVALLVFALITSMSTSPATAATATPAKSPIPVIVDLDIGDDIDDGFALALLLSSPEIELRGISTAWGDTTLRVRLVERLLRELGRNDVPVFAGVPTASTNMFTQARWASGPHLPGQADPPARQQPPPGGSIDFMLQQARSHPGEITLLALAPLSNLAAAIARDPVAFRQFKQVVMMGGSIRQGYSRSDYAPPRPPSAEYNIVSDIAAAQALFGSGVPIVMMPLDSTELRMDDQKRAAVFSHGSVLTDDLALMYLQWSNADQPWSSATSTLYDVVPVAWLLEPSVCPLVPMHITVNAEGYTRESPGTPNAQVCLHSDKPAIFELLMGALLR